MSSDMSKKPSLFIEKKSAGVFLQQQMKSDRVYNTVKECL
jgi:hypothetical protein